MKKEFERFDMNKKPIQMKWYLKPLSLILSYPDYKKHKVQITKTNMEGIKPPYLLLCNHNSFIDFKVATMAVKPICPNYVVAIDGFIGREGLLRGIGAICKRKFTNDLVLIKQLKYCVNKGWVPCIYPEARYSLCGTNAVLPESLGKLCKMLKVPVVTLICHGHHVNAPFYNTKDHGVKGLEAELSLLFTAEDLANLSVEEINDGLNKRFEYDDYKWALDNKKEIPYAKRAEGLDKVLYQCPVCGKEYHMSSSGINLKCDACGATWEMNIYGQLHCLNNKETFTHIPDWYEWERANVRKEVENGTYDSGELKCHVNSLPNAKKFIFLGNGTLRHNMDGFVCKGIDVDGDLFEMIKPVDSLYSTHIEYNYLNKFGDCVDLNTNNDTWYIYPEGNEFSVTKFALATEELYQLNQRKLKENNKK